MKIRNVELSINPYKMLIKELQELLAKKAEKQHKPRHIESKIQRACVGWFRMQFPQYIIFAVPNGGSRNAIEAANLKREGALAGVADLIILADNGRTLFVEMKTASGRQSTYQKQFEKDVTRLGFTYKVVRSFAEFESVVNKWIFNINNNGNSD